MKVFNDNELIKKWDAIIALLSIDEYNPKSIQAIRKLPTIESERKKGKWLELTNTNHTYVCSVCGRTLVNITDGKNKVTKNYPFCHCGADMRGEQDD